MNDTFFSRHKFHLLLIGVSAVWLLLFGYVSQIGSQGIIYYDSMSYLESAKNLYVFHRGHQYRPMLMAAINGIPYIFGFGDSAIYEFSFYVNVFCWLVSGVLLFESLRDFLKPKTAFWFALAFFFTLGNVAYIFHLLTEHIYLFFILSAFYCLSKYYKTKAFKWLSIALSIFILAMLIRPGSMLLAIVLCLFFIREVIRNFKSKFAYLIYGSVMLVLVQCAGLKYQFGNFTVSYIDAITYYGYLSCRAESLKNGTEFVQSGNPRGLAMYLLPTPEQKKLAAADFKYQLTENTGNLFKAYFIDLYDNTKSGTTALMNCKKVDDHIFLGAELFSISKWQNRILTLIGFALAVFFFFTCFRKEPLHFLMAGYILYIILLSGISCAQGDRFHMVTYPFILLLLAKWLQQRKILPQ